MSWVPIGMEGDVALSTRMSKGDWEKSQDAMGDGWVWVEGTRFHFPFSFLTGSKRTMRSLACLSSLASALPLPTPSSLSSSLAFNPETGAVYVASESVDSKGTIELELVVVEGPKESDVSTVSSLWCAAVNFNMLNVVRSFWLVLFFQPARYPYFYRH